MLKEALLVYLSALFSLISVEEAGLSNDLDRWSPKLGSYLGVFALELLFSTLFLGVELDDLDRAKDFLLLDLLRWLLETDDLDISFPEVKF